MVYEGRFKSGPRKGQRYCKGGEVNGAVHQGMASLIGHPTLFSKCPPEPPPKWKDPCALPIKKTGVVLLYNISSVKNAIENNLLSNLHFAPCNGSFFKFS